MLLWPKINIIRRRKKKMSKKKRKKNKRKRDKGTKMKVNIGYLIQTHVWSIIDGLIAFNIIFLLFGTIHSSSIMRYMYLNLYSKLYEPLYINGDPTIEDASGGWKIKGLTILTLTINQ